MPQKNTYRSYGIHGFCGGNRVLSSNCPYDSSLERILDRCDIGVMQDVTSDEHDKILASTPRNKVVRAGQTYIAIRNDLVLDDSPIKTPKMSDSVGGVFLDCANSHLFEFNRDIPNIIYDDFVNQTYKLLPDGVSYCLTNCYRDYDEIYEYLEANSDPDYDDVPDPESYYDGPSEEYTNNLAEVHWSLRTNNTGEVHEGWKFNGKFWVHCSIGRFLNSNYEFGYCVGTLMFKGNEEDLPDVEVY